MAMDITVVFLVLLFCFVVVVVVVVVVVFFFLTPVIIHTNCEQTQDKLVRQIIILLSGFQT